MESKEKTCLTPYCTSKTHDHKYCPKCRHRQLGSKDLTRHVYYYWKSNCKRRGIPNIVTLEQFRKFCRDTGYIQKKGRKKRDLCIDRIRNDEGYHINNIRAITNIENLIKARKEDKACPF